MKDYYSILEVSPDETPSKIRNKYHILIQAWHPDKFRDPDHKAEAEERTKQINEAYYFLGDPQRRAKYDKEWSSKSSYSESAERYKSEEEQNRQAEEAEQARRRAEYERQQRKGTEAAQRRAAKGANQKQFIALMAVLVLGVMLISVFRSMVSASKPLVPTSTPTRIPRTPEDIISRITYSVSYLDKGEIKLLDSRISKTGVVTRRYQDLTLSIRNGNSEAYCLNGTAYYDAGDGIVRSTYLFRLGSDKPEVFDSYYAINGIGYGDAGVTVCIGNSDSLRIAGITRVQITMRTWQLPQFPISTPHHLRIKKILITEISLWGHSEMIGPLPPLGIPLAEENTN